MSKELQLSAASQAQKTSVRIDGNKQKEDVADIKLRRQAKNKLKKDENKRAREEELRRKLYEPKDQRIRVVKRSEIERILNTSVVRSDASGSNVPNITADDFPCLGKSRPTERSRYTEEQQVVSNSRQNSNQVNWPNTVKSSSECDKSKTNTNSQDSTQSCVATTPTHNPHRKPKRNAPLKIEVLSALKKSKPVPAQVQSSKPKPKKNVPQLSGNQLDASNPTRNKGKKREVQKDKKPSNLKLVILQEREIKRALVKELADVEEDSCLVEETNKDQDDRNATSIDDTSKPPTIDEIVRQFEDEQPVVIDARDVEKEENICNKKSLSQNNNQKKHEQIVDPLTSEKIKFHSRKFREYCNHVLSAELDSFVSALVKDIVRFQDRLYFNDPIKAHAKRRFVLGFRETKKYLALKKLKLLIIAPDLEKVQSAGGIDDTVEELKAISASQGIPCIFALGRKLLKKLTNKSFKISGISCMGVMNYEGTQENFNAIVSLLPKLRNEYEEQPNQEDISAEQTQVAAIEATGTEETSPLDVNQLVVSSFLMKLSNEISKK